MLVSICLALLALLVSYIYWNDRAIHHVPKEVLGVSPHRWTPEEVKEAYKRQLSSPQDILPRLPPKTGRKYIVVGGAGFLGGWIIVHLIRRGEDPRNIRILDIQRPTRRDLLTGPATQVEFMQVDISDRDAVFRAFRAPWPSTEKTSLTSDEQDKEITVFHTAANIRFFERHIDFLPRSTRINRDGTQNVVDAARDIGVDTMIYTSSGATLVHSNRFLLWPWERRPKYFVQAINDDDNLIPKVHSGFFSNYAASKAQGEKVVRSANMLPTGEAGKGKVLRTGSLRPGNGVFGPGGDMLCGAALVRRNNPTWIPDIVHNFLYVENGSLAHLCFEAKLIHAAASPSPSIPPQEDLSGRAYCICDVGPPPTYGDVYRLLSTLTDNEVYFPLISPTLMLLVAHLVEAYHLLQSRVHLPRLLPPIKGDIINVQPSLFSLVQTHLIFDDSRARKELDYDPVWTTMEGLCKTVQEHEIEERLNEATGVGKTSSVNGRADMAGFSIELCCKRKKKTKKGSRLARLDLPALSEAVPEVQSIAVPR
ncbi:NAD-P-binding protein [Pterulicium gracile]|uniref:NAD-P-binding protein n=1 Tax=Pterulicium gracile TaxID=1884261 RepID=A0A5C3QIH0_9AGAR|nr:NAD-P-binding protein [Pterula gracilis]